MLKDFMLLIMPRLVVGWEKKETLIQDKKWNLNYNTIEDILGVQLKEFVKNLKENPKNGHRLLVINNVINQSLLINQLRIGWSLKMNTGMLLHLEMSKRCILECRSATYYFKREVYYR